MNQTYIAFIACNDSMGAIIHGLRTRKWLYPPKGKKLTVEKYITIEVIVTGNNNFDDLRWIALQQ